MTIVFETHATSIDNEKGVSSGWYDVELSELGIRQARELGKRYESDPLEAVFCSDLERSYRTAEIAFQGREIPIIRDARLRECDYGELTRHPSSQVAREKPKRVRRPFPQGESYRDTARRMRSFLDDLRRDYEGKKVKVMVIGHAATRYALEFLIKGIPLEDAVSAPWSWEPGWTYVLPPLEGATEP